MAIDDVSFYHVAPASPQDRFAEALMDNVQGTFQVTTEAVRQAYDTLSDNTLDYSKWHVAGTVEEWDGMLKLPLFRGGVAMNGYVSTADMPNGMNLRGFRVHADRTPSPKTVGATPGHEFETTARMRLTNGQDWIEVGWYLKTNAFQVETHGAYGNTAQGFPAASNQIIDGTFEVRERNGNIEVLHDNQVQCVFQNQTVRAGSFFTFETNGNPENVGDLRDHPTDFDLKINDLWFYSDLA